MNNPSQDQQPVPSDSKPANGETTDDNTEESIAGQQSKDSPEHIAQDATAPEEVPADDLPPEHGGQKGPEPTRYGDWEKKGRCTDF